MKLSKKIRILVVVVVLIIFSLGVAVKLSESVYTENCLIELSKRGIAQLGGFVINRIHDPYAAKARKATTGFEIGLQNKGICAEGEIVNHLSKFVSQVRLVKFANRRIVEDALNFAFQPYEDRKLKLLCSKYALNKVIEPAKSQFEEMVLLMKWVRNQWKYGRTKDVSYNFDSLDILARAKNGEQFFCSEYATTYVQCAAAVGFQARYLGLFANHVVPEIWSDQYEKWVVMDVTHNCYFTEKGIPLNALELHRLYNTNCCRDVAVVRDLSYPDSDVFNFSDGRILSNFSQGFYVRMRNDWFANKYPHWHPKANSIMNGIEWRDEYTQDNLRYPLETKDERRIYFPLDVVMLAMGDIKEEADAQVCIEIFFNTITPNFAHFSIKIDEGEPFLTNKYNFSWHLHKGNNSLRVIPINKFGRPGIESSIVLEGS